MCLEVSQAYILEFSCKITISFVLEMTVRCMLHRIIQQKVKFIRWIERVFWLRLDISAITFVLLICRPVKVKRPSVSSEEPEKQPPTQYNDSHLPVNGKIPLRSGSAALMEATEADVVRTSHFMHFSHLHIDIIRSLFTKCIPTFHDLFQSAL